MAQLDRASDFGSEGWGFESLWVYIIRENPDLFGFSFFALDCVMSSCFSTLSALDAESPSDILFLSYNILLPNHSNWWVFKYYRKEDREKYSSWPYRKGLLAEQILSANADVISLQEVSPDSFLDDFDFLFPEYHGVCHRKSNIACALFWKKNRFTEKTTRYRDRSIISILEDQRNGAVIAAVSCHLSAGSQPKRRFQQMHAICTQLAKEQKRFPIELMIVGGDFNATAEHTAVKALLDSQVVGPCFREDRYPDIEISSKERQQNIGIFQDCYQVRMT